MERLTAMPPRSDGSWVRLPPDYRPSTIPKSRFEEFAQLKVRQGSGDVWLFKTVEEYLNAAKPGIRLSLIARGTDFDAHGLQRLTHLIPITDTTSPERLQGLAEFRRQQVAMSLEDEPLWNRFVGELQIALDSELENSLRDLQSHGDAQDSLWLAECDPVLMRRLGVMRTLFAQRFTADAIRAENFGGFGAARYLMLNSTAMFTLYLQPPLLLDSPWVGGYAVSRLNATFIRALHRMEPGRVGVWTDPLDSFKPGYAGGSGFISPIQNRQDLATREEFLRWWTRHVSELLWLVTNPTRFVDATGTYSPNEHLGTVLTVERIFVTAVEIMRLRTRDEVLRKILLFQLLDLLEGHGMGNFVDNLHHDKQRALWSAMKPGLPEPVTRAIEPVIDGAFQALKSIEEEFWRPSARTAEGHLLIDKKEGVGQEAIEINRARGEYIKVFRNSHHGFKDIANNPRNLSYLASHTGSLDDRLADLAWWYLIRLLNNPESLFPWSRR
ncbi:MAG TPA: hypothetical protein VMV52_01975 [Candidatus Nanopelagicaceae bacterium]|nr:hypothetical protein [Candidatus Nanopelagicaceae bacterium]